MFTVFDDISKRAYSQTLDVFGEHAVWLRQSKTEGGSQTSIDGNILFKCPTQKTPIGNSDAYDYKSDSPTAEYYIDTFTGLKELCDKQINQYLIIRNQKYFITSIDTKFDGDTYVAYLELINN